MRAVILAGGKGRRLAPYTTVFPKPLVPIGDYPILEILVRQLAAQEITDITLSVGYLSELIHAYFQQHPTLLNRLSMSYVREEKPTGTAGSLASVPDLNETFLVMNGDVLTTLNFQALVTYHRQQGAALTIATHPKQVQIDLGVLVRGAEGRVTGYREKPQYEYDVSMGIYVYEPHVLRYIERGEYLDFPDLVLRLLAANEFVSAYPSRDRWLDIGRREDYELAQQEFSEHRDEFCAGFKDDIEDGSS